MASTPWRGRFDKVRIAYSAATASELVGYDVEIADVGWRGEELVGFLREGLSDGPAKMRLACRLVRERVDNAERRRAEPNREPMVSCRVPARRAAAPTAEIPRLRLLCRTWPQAVPAMPLSPWLISLFCGGSPEPQPTSPQRRSGPFASR